MARRHVALAVAVAVVWGLNFVVIDEGLKVFPPLFFVALRFAVVLVPAIFVVKRPRVPARYVIGVGAFSGALQFGLDALAFVVAGSAAWGIGNVITRIARPPEAVNFLVWTSLVPPVPLLLLSLIIEGPARISAAGRSLTVSAVLALLYVAYVSTGFGYAAWAFLLRRYPASTVSPFALVVPVVGLASAAIFVHENPSVAEVAGAVVVLAGLAMVTRSVHAPAPVAPTVQLIGGDVPVGADEDHALPARLRAP